MKVIWQIIGFAVTFIPWFARNWVGDFVLKLGAEKLLKENGLDNTIMINSLSMNFKDGILDVALMLDGESDAITIHASGVHLRSEGENAFIDIAEANVSKRWLNTLVRQFEGFPRSIPIPSENIPHVKLFFP